MRTEAVTRVLEALAPALAAELDRFICEAQQHLEMEFQERLESAIHEAEVAIQRSNQLQLEHAIAEAEETVRARVTQELQSQFSTTLEGVHQQSKEKMDQDWRAATDLWTAERTRLQDQRDEWRMFAEAQQQLAQCSSQAEILARFLKLAEPFATSAALYIAKADGLALWKARGQAAFPELISQDTIDPEFYFRPVVIRNRSVAAVCAVQPYRLESLDFLTACLQQAIEIFGLKLRSPMSRPVGMTNAPASRAGAAYPGPLSV